MNRFIIFAFLLLNISCATTTERQPYNADMASINIGKSPIKEEPYELNIEIEKSDKEYNLIVAVDLKGGSFFGSPFSNNDFTGLFEISIEDNKHLVMGNSLIETPPSVETIDPYGNVPVNWVNVNTTYTQNLKLLTQGDFEVTGKVKFVIEPHCTLEEVLFTVFYEEGKMIVKKE